MKTIITVLCIWTSLSAFGQTSVQVKPHDILDVDNYVQDITEKALAPLAADTLREYLYLDSLQYAWMWEGDYLVARDMWYECRDEYNQLISAFWDKKENIEMKQKQTLLLSQSHIPKIHIPLSRATPPEKIIIPLKFP